MKHIPLEMWFLIIGASILISSLITVICYKKISNLIWAQRIKNKNLWNKNFLPIIEELIEVLKEAEDFSHKFARFLEERNKLFQSSARGKELANRPREIVAQRANNLEAYSTAANNLRQKTTHINQLASAGWRVADIAWQLGLSREEVQLILNLSQNAPNKIFDFSSLS
jgi:hypothetical protein